MDRAPGTDHLRECLSVVPGLVDACGECECWCHLTPAERTRVWEAWRDQQDVLAVLEVSLDERPRTH